uniref:PTPc_motif domain-containing protein n=1 Tax=Heterorhabditis bacteriophora TaxID=37862 RepID=A0A1I7X5M9_HETBA
MKFSSRMNSTISVCNLQILNVGINTTKDPLFRVTFIKITGPNGNEHRVEHWQADMNNSSNVQSPLKLLQIARNCSHPVIIHDHLGSFCFYIFSCIFDTSYIQHPIQKAVHFLRLYRPFSVETPMQYIFIHRIIQRFFCEPNGGVREMEADYKKWLSERTGRMFIDDLEASIPGYRLLSPRIDPDLLRLVRHPQRPNHRREAPDCVGELPVPLERTEFLSGPRPERTYLLEIASFNILREIRSMYGKSLTHTDFVLNLQSLKVAINDMINDHQVWFGLNVVMEEIITYVLADEEYMNCIKTHSHEWIHYFGKEPEKMTRRIAESIHRFRLLDQILTILHREVVSAEQSIDKNCVEQYSSVTGCRNCVADEIGYCRSSCKSVLSNCFSNLSMGWVDRLESLKRLSVDFEKGFYELERGIKSGHRKLVESNSPLLARAVVSRCGSVRGRFVPLGNISVIHILKPKDVKIKTERLIQQSRKNP